MKKVYISPETIQVKIATDNLLVIVSGTEAGSGEAGNSRQDESDWDE